MVAYAFAPVAAFPQYGGYTYGHLTADGVPYQAYLARPGYVPPVPDKIITLNDALIIAGIPAPAHAIASFIMHTDGKAYSAVNGGANILKFQWIDTPASAAQYEVRMQSMSGNPTSGTMNAWLPMTAIRTWTVDMAFVGNRQFQGKLSIRKIGTTDILDDCVVTLDCTVT